MMIYIITGSNDGGTFFIMSLTVNEEEEELNE